MAKVTAGLPQGTRDFGPDVVRKRNYILSTIKNVFELYGFQPLETPAMENLDTLMGKYGEEGDKLIFKILNNGLDNPGKEKQVRDDFEKVLQGKNNKGITERALKYDLTIPFARYVAMNHAQLTFPFKRYQVQPVWRADRPQKGRYREFYQCDADVVGSNSPLNEVELAIIYATVFSKLGIAVEIKINSRKVLTAMAEICGGADKMTDITVAIDKLDKIGLEKVKEELAQRGLTAEQVRIIEKYLSITGTNEDKLVQVKQLLEKNDAGKKGIEEIEYLCSEVKTQSLQLSIDFTLARGLNYYTGIIFEVKANNVQMGSIGGGGRYDDLTGLFGVPNIPGVGISFGVDRIYDVMEELQLFPEEVHISTQVLFFNLGEAESKVAFHLLQQLREKGIRGELYHENSKFDKQFK
ncbi:MAG: histidine--tRNA ligase, partial [Chitinophagaceae bacterium]|nr:histidine--tRNA ligase [Chitinophagaceae bacterium]